MSDLQFYWLVIAPAALIGLQAIGWIVLWATREKRNHHKQGILDFRPRHQH